MNLKQTWMFYVLSILYVVYIFVDRLTNNYKPTSFQSKLFYKHFQNPNTDILLLEFLT